MRKNFASLCDRFSENTIVRGVSAGRDLFDGQQASLAFTEVGDSEKEYTFNMFRVFPYFIETMGLEIVEGRTFREEDGNSGFILNEAAANMIGSDGKDVLDRQLKSFMAQGSVIGIVKDFNFTSLHSEIAPLIIFVPRTKVEYLYVRVAPGNIAQTLSSLEDDFRAVVPNLPFDYLFLDQHIDEMYRQDRRFSQLAYLFCGLSIILACLGLYGTISVMTETRTKEIGIRKVLGASNFGIASLLSGQFVLLVLVAGLIALPLAKWLLEQWLDNFAYRVIVSTDILLLSILLPLVLASVAVCYQSVKAANANPIDSLRTE